MVYQVTRHTAVAAIVSGLAVTGFTTDAFAQDSHSPGFGNGKLLKPPRHDILVFPLQLYGYLHECFVDICRVFMPVQQDAPLEKTLC